MLSREGKHLASVAPSAEDVEVQRGGETENEKDADRGLLLIS